MHGPRQRTNRKVSDWRGRCDRFKPPPFTMKCLFHSERRSIASDMHVATEPPGDVCGAGQSFQAIVIGSICASDVESYSSAILALARWCGRCFILSMVDKVRQGTPSRESVEARRSTDSPVHRGDGCQRPCGTGGTRPRSPSDLVDASLLSSSRSWSSRIICCTRP